MRDIFQLFPTTAHHLLSTSPKIKTRKQNKCKNIRDWPLTCLVRKRERTKCFVFHFKKLSSSSLSLPNSKDALGCLHFPPLDSCQYYGHSQTISQLVKDKEGANNITTMPYPLKGVLTLQFAFRDPRTSNMKEKFGRWSPVPTTFV